MSWSARDLAEGYCGRCRDWTGAEDSALVCDACGAVRPSPGTGRFPVIACDRGHSPALMRPRWAVPDVLEPQGLFQYVQADPLTLAQTGDMLAPRTAGERREAAAADARLQGEWLAWRYGGIPGSTVNEAARFAAGLGLDVPPVSRHQVESAFTACQREWFEETGLLVNRWQADLLGPPPGNNPVNGPRDSNLSAQAASSWETDIWDEEDWADAATWHPGYGEL